VLRPIIRDLISVYDDMFEIHRQLTATISSFEEKEIVGGAICLIENMRQAVNNLDHNVHFILEVLERLDVSQTQTNIGKLDKRTQKAVAVETTDNPDTDQEIVKILKRGFQWKDRIMRPEEVIIRKWKEPTPLSLAKAPAEAIPSI
jgi:molecular chaperone GrpE (heat shock protein)